jgi:monoamine oxidase
VDNPGRQASSSSTPGANVSNSIAQSNPYTTTATNAQVTTLAQDLLTQMEPIFPGITKQWNGKAMLSTRSPTLTSSAPTPTGNRASTPPSAATKRRRQWNIDFAGEHCSQDFQGFIEGGASEGLRAASEVLADLKRCRTCGAVRGLFCADSSATISAFADAT